MPKDKTPLYCYANKEDANGVWICLQDYNHDGDCIWEED